MNLSRDRWPSKCSFVSFILNQFASIYSVNVIFPREIVVMITSIFFLVETHIYITGICRDTLFEQLWKFAILKDDRNIIDHDFQLNKAKEGLAWETFVFDYKDIPIWANIYQKDDLINVSYFDYLYGKDTFQYVVNLIRKWKNRPHFNFQMRIHKEKLTSMEILPLKKNQKVLIRHNRSNDDTAAEGIVINPVPIFMVEITETYSVYYNIGEKWNFDEIQLALPSLVSFKKKMMMPKRTGKKKF